MKLVIVKLTLVALLATTLSACVIHVGGKKGQKANVHFTESLELSTGDLTSLTIEAGAGDLTVLGVEGQTRILVNAEIRTTEQKDYQLTLRQNGDSAELVAKHHSTSGYWTGSSPQIHLTVSMPASFELNIDDGSGEVSISNVKSSIDLEDGSGSILVERTIGDVNIDDGSGDLVIKNTSGNINIDDGSGEIYVADIVGNLLIEDSSGDLVVTQVSGMVTLDDGSGDIEVNTAGGLTIIESGSGGLSISGIKGNVSIDD